MPEIEKEHKPSVVDGKLVRCSVSQVKTFEDCPRKWAYDKVFGLERVEKEFLKVGTEGHAQIEHYLKTGEDVRGPLARSGADMLESFSWAFPFKGGRGLVECAIEDPPVITPGGITIVGYLDFMIPPHGGRTEPIIIDHKFRKDVHKWAETPEDLQSEPQAITYANWALRKWDSLAVIFRHHNHEKKGKPTGTDKGIPREARLTRDEVFSKWKAIELTIDHKIAPLAGIKTPEEAPYNTEACSKFGGCDFEKVCPNSPTGRFASRYIPPKDPKMGLLDGLKAASAGAVNPTTPPPANVTATGAPRLFNVPQETPAAPVQLSAPPVAASGKIMAKFCRADFPYTMPDGRLLAFKGNFGADAFFAGADGNPIKIAGTVEVTPQFPDPEGVTQTERAKGGSKLFVTEQLIVPPDAPVSASPATVTPVVASVPTIPVQAMPQAAAPVVAPTPIQATNVSTGSATPDAPAPKKRGRKSNAEKAAIAAAAAANGQPVPVEEPETEEPETEAAGSLVLLVDCACNRPTKDLNAYTAQLCASILAQIPEKDRPADVRFSAKKMQDGSDHPLAFGGWKAVLSLAALNSPPSGLCSINRSELTEPVIEALAGRASLVVRG